MYMLVTAAAIGIERCACARECPLHRQISMRAARCTARLFRGARERKQ